MRKDDKYVVLTGGGLGRFYRVVRWEINSSQSPDVTIVLGPTSRLAAERLASAHNAEISKYQKSLRQR